MAMMNKSPMYRIAGQSISARILLAYEDEPVISVVSKQRDELALECYVYHGGERVAVARGDRMFAVPGKEREFESAAKRYNWEHLPTGQRLTDLETKSVVADLVRHADRPTYMVTLDYTLPNGMLVKATPESLNVAGAEYTGNRDTAGDAFIAIRCTKLKAPITIA